MTEGIPVAPGMEDARLPRVTAVVDARVALLSAAAVALLSAAAAALGLAAGVLAEVLVNGSRIPARLTFLKPLSAAIAIGTGGPFGAEGPIIATGGALGKLIRRPVAVALEGSSLREAADHMVREGVGRLPVVGADGRLAGILTRSDLLDAHALRLGDG